MKLNPEISSALLEQHRSETEWELRRSFEQCELPFYNLLRYHLGWVDPEGKPAQVVKGKSLRSTLCLLANEAVGGNPRQILPAAAALELLHNFTLIHDDVQDEDLERRHRPTVWAIWGKSQAINAGDALHALAALTMLRLRERDIPAEKTLWALQVLEESCLKVIEGQYLDLSFEERLDIRVEAYLEMVERKTAALFEGAAWMGASLGTEDEELVTALRGYGKELGFAFQIRDDILGIWGSQERTGKNPGTDLRRRKKTLPIVHALQISGELRELYQKKEFQEEEVSLAVEILERCGSRKFAQELAQEHCQRALAHLAEPSLRESPKDSLRELALFSAKRDF